MIAANGNIKAANDNTFVAANIQATAAAQLTHYPKGWWFSIARLAGAGQHKLAKVTENPQSQDAYQAFFGFLRASVAQTVQLF